MPDQTLIIGTALGGARSIPRGGYARLGNSLLQQRCYSCSTCMVLGNETAPIPHFTVSKLITAVVCAPKCSIQCISLRKSTSLLYSYFKKSSALATSKLLISMRLLVQHYTSMIVLVDWQQSKSYSLLLFQ